MAYANPGAWYIDSGPTIGVTDLGTSSNAAGATLTLTSVGCPAGSLVVVMVNEATATSAGTSSLSDGTNTYTAGPSVALGGSQGFAQTFYHYYAGAQSGLTLTYTKATTGHTCCLSGLYASGIASSTPLDSAVSATAAGTSTTPTVTSGTPSQSGDLIIGYGAWGGASAQTFALAAAPPAFLAPPTAVTTQAAACGGGGSFQYCATGTITFTGTLSGSVTGNGLIILGFKPASAPTEYYGVAAWAASTSYSPGALVRQNLTPTVGNERVFVSAPTATATGAHTSGASEPTWVVTKGGQVVDNTNITWQEVTGQPGVNGDISAANCPVWTVSSTPPLGLVIYDSTSASLQICSTSGAGGSGAAPSFSATAGTVTTDSSAKWTSLGAASNFTKWSAPFARLAAASTTNWAVNGNTIFVGDDHAETQASALVISTPSAGLAQMLILCVDHTASVPPGSGNLKTTASINNTGANNLALTGSAYVYGINFSCGTSGTPTLGTTAYVPPAIRQSAILGTPSSDAAFSVTLSEAPLDGSLLLALYGWISAAGAPGTGTGYTQFGANNNGTYAVAGYYKYAGASESATQTPANSAICWCGILYEITGVTGTWADDFIAAHTGLGVATGGNITSWSTAYNNELVLGFTGVQSPNDPQSVAFGGTGGAGATDQQYEGSYHTTYGYPYGLGAHWTPASSGTTFDQTITQSPAYGSNNNYIFVELTANSLAQSNIRLDSCALAFGVGVGNGIFGFGDGSRPQEVEMFNTTLSFSGTGQTITSQCFFHWRNTASAILGSAAPTTLISTNSTGQSTLEGIDLSALGSSTTLVGNNNTSQGAFSVYMTGCKLGASVIVAAAVGLPGEPETDLVNCDSTGAVYRQERYRAGGNLVASTGVVRTGGASDGVTPISWLLTTTANVTLWWGKPFTSFPISIWNSVTGTNRNVTLYGLWNSASLPNNDQIWVDVEYLGSASSPLASLQSGTKANALATGTALTADSTSVWGSAATARQNSHAYSTGNVIAVADAAAGGQIFFCTSGGTSAGSEPGGYASAVDGGVVTDGGATFRAATRFQLSVTLSSPHPQLAGYLRATVKAALASTTFYVDPLLNLS